MFGSGLIRPLPFVTFDPGHSAFSRWPLLSRSRHGALSARTLPKTLTIVLTRFTHYLSCCSSSYVKEQYFSFKNNKRPLRPKLNDPHDGNIDVKRSGKCYIPQWSISKNVTRVGHILEKCIRICVNVSCFQLMNAVRNLTNFAAPHLFISLKVSTL